MHSLALASRVHGSSACSAEDVYASTHVPATKLASHGSLPRSWTHCSPLLPPAAPSLRRNCSGIYRNKASAEELPTTYNGCSTLYEVTHTSAFSSCTAAAAAPGSTVCDGQPHVALIS